MKILQIIPTLDQGGAEHFVAELSVALVRAGEECDVLTLYDIKEDNNLLNELKGNNIRVISLRKRDGLDLSVFFKLIFFIRKGNYNVVQTHVGATKYILVAAFTLPSVKFFATLHSEAKREAGKSLDLWARKVMFKLNKCVPVTISEESEKSFEDFYGKNAVIILNGVSEYKKGSDIILRDNENQIVFIHPASCQPVKNQKLLLRAFAKLTEEYPNTKLIWVGNDKAYPLLFKQLQSLFVTQVCYCGNVPNVRDLLCQADGMCLSSLMEGLPMTIIEAFSVKCVPICTPVGGCVNVIKNGKNGILSEGLTVDDYFKALKKYCVMNEEDRKIMREEAYKSYGRYNIDKCAESYINLYKKYL